MNRKEVAPEVSAVITTHNRQHLVGRAIRSVLNQTYKDLEIIVVDDCSSDKTQEVVSGVKDSRVQYIRLERNSGGVAARNTGTKMASGKYVAFLDDDDEWQPEKLEKQVKLAESRSEDYAVINCGATIMNEHGEILATHMPRLRGQIRSEILEKGLATIPSSHLFRKEALEIMGGYDESLPTHNEHDIWMEMGRRGYRCDYVDEPLVIAHQHSGYQMTKDMALRVRGTDLYLQKWQPVIEEWLGKKRGQK